MTFLQKCGTLFILYLLPFFCVSQTATELAKAGIVKSKDKDYAGPLNDYDRAIALDSGVTAILFFKRQL